MSSTNTSFASLTTSFTTSTSEFICSTCQKRFKKQNVLSRHLNIVKKYNIPRNDLDRALNGLAIMVNNNPKIVAQLYGLFLYKKKDIIAIQEKLSIGGNVNQLAVPPVSELMGKTLADSYELLLELSSTDISLGEIFNLLMYLEKDIIAIQEELNIIGYTNQEMAEKANENARAYLQKFEEYYSPLEDVPSVLIQRFIDKRLKMFYFTGEKLPLFPKVTPQQLHEIFVKNLAGTDQCPCLEQIR
ncbi:hypothetical protein RhiirC2_793597 [Rhizophagus irregularis]|uniref:C2H2-type domain-containing protein n=1 Tax=Rhizophagus irregularis TaxID=588596 RepID=A0A2N1MF49_9GLOM|nr:hypothetical protein RhiirC2_793597 [Rhizophagus irregularis]